MTRSWIHGCVVVLAVLGVTAAATAGASGARGLPGSQEPTHEAATRLTQQTAGTGEYPPVSEQLLEDLSQSGDLSEELIQRNRGNDEFSVFTTRLENERSGIFASSGVPRYEGERHWILLTRPAEQSLLDEIERLPMPVDVISGAQLNATEFELVSAAALSELHDTGVSLSASSLEENEYSKIVIEYARAESADEAEIADAHDRVRARISRELGDRGSIEVEFKDDGELIEPEATVRGSRRLTSGSSDCTSGFTAKRNGNRGVLTARHCPNNLKYRGIDEVITFGAVVLRQDCTWYPRRWRVRAQLLHADRSCGELYVGVSTNN